MNHIFYQTKTKFSNSGDTLINKALLETLRGYGTIYANCSNSVPNNFLKELGIESSEKVVTKNELSFAIEVIKCAIKNKKDKVYVFSGLGDVHGGGVKRSIRNLMSTGVLIIYNMFGIKSVRIGRSIGKITKVFGKSEVIRSRFVTHNYVRDSESLRRCKSIGMKRVEVCPDMSWLYMKSTKREYNDTNTVVVNMRGSTLGKYDEGYAKVIMDRCGEVIAELQKVKGHDVNLKFVYQVIEDKKITKELYEKYRYIYKSEYIDKQLNLDDMNKVYGDAAFHVSNRMHSLLLGYKYGSLPIALLDKEKHLKIVNTFRDCKMDNLLIDMYDVSSIKEFVYDVFTNRKEHYKKLVDCEKKMQINVKYILDNIM